MHTHGCDSRVESLRQPLGQPALVRQSGIEFDVLECVTQRRHYHEVEAAGHGLFITSADSAESRRISDAPHGEVSRLHGDAVSGGELEIAAVDAASVKD